MLVPIFLRVDLVAKNTVIARFGGDEFAILLGNIKVDHFVVTIADRLKEILSRPFNVDGKEIYTTVSIGIAVSVTNNILYVLYIKPLFACKDIEAFHL